MTLERMQGLPEIVLESYVCGDQAQLMWRTRHFATLQPHPFIQLAAGGKALRMATQLQQPSLSFLWDHQVPEMNSSCLANSFPVQQS